MTPCSVYLGPIYRMGSLTTKTEGVYGPKNTVVGDGEGVIVNVRSLQEMQLLCIVRERCGDGGLTVECCVEAEGEEVVGDAEIVYFF